MNSTFRHQDSRVRPLGDRLRRAEAWHALLRIERSIEHADTVVGHVVGVGQRWLLVSVMAAGLRNGWVALRMQDVEDVEEADGGRFVRHGLEFQKSWPPSAPAAAIRLSGGARALMESVASSFYLASAYRERLDPSAMHVGRPSSFSAGQLAWQGMSPAGRWETEVTPMKSAQVTRLDFGGQYEAALAHAADLRALGSTRADHHPFDQLPGEPDARPAGVRPTLSLG